MSNQVFRFILWPIREFNSYPIDVDQKGELPITTILLQC